MTYLLDRILPKTHRPGDLQGTLEHLASIAPKEFSAQVCVVHAINPNTGEYLSPITSGGLPDSKPLAVEHQEEQRAAARDLLRRGQSRIGPLCIADMDGHPNHAGLFPDSLGIRSFGAVSLQTDRHSKSLGVLFLGFQEVQTFPAEARESLRLFANHAAFALEEVWSVARYQAVQTIGRKINEASGTAVGTAEHIFNELAKHMPSILDITHFLLLALYQQDNSLDMYMLERGKFKRLPKDPLEGASKWVIENQKGLLIRDLPAEKDQLHTELVHITGTLKGERSLIYEPIIAGGVTLGVLSAQHRKANTYSEEDQRILRLLADHMGLALSNRRLFEDLTLLNDTGQVLTSRFQSPKLLELVADSIQEATKADIVILYPFDQKRDVFVLPPCVGGTLKYPKFRQPGVVNKDDIAALALQKDAPVWAEASAELYKKLGGTPGLRHGNFEERENIASTAVVPLRVEDQPVGVLFVNYHQAQTFSAAQKQFIEGLARFAAIAIRNAQALGTLSERHREELRILKAIDHLLNSTQDLDEILKPMLDEVHKLIPAAEASILLFEPGTRDVAKSASIGRNARVSREALLGRRISTGIIGWVLKHRQPQRIDNLDTEKPPGSRKPWRAIHVPVAEDIKSELDVPLLSEDGKEVVGIINFEDPKEGRFSQEDFDFLLTLAGQVVLALQRARDYAREKRLLAESQDINNISKELTGQLDPKKIYKMILESALTLTGAEVGNLRIYDTERKDLWVAAQRGMDESLISQRLTLKEGVTGRALRLRKLQNVGDVTRPPWDRIYVPFADNMRSELAVPLLEGPDKKRRGVLNIENSTPNKFTRRDEDLLKVLAELALIAIQNAEHYEAVDRERKRFEMLYEVGHRLGRLTDVSQMGRAYNIAESYARSYSKSEVIVREYDSRNRTMVLVKASPQLGFDPPKLRDATRGLQGDVARYLRPRVVNDMNKLPPDIEPEPTNLHYRSLVIAPIKFEDNLYGSMDISHEKAHYFRKDDVLFIQGLAHQLGITIHRLKISDQQSKTEKRALEAEAISSISESAYELSHRLINELGTVPATVDEALRELQKLEVSSDLIDENLQEVKEQVSIVLNLSKALTNEIIEAKDEQNEYNTAVDVSAEVLLRDAVGSFNQWPKRIKVRYSIEPDLPDVHVVPTRIVHALRNLITNAIDAMPDAGRLTLSAQAVGENVVLSVRDSGTGIAKEDQDKIFDLIFSRKDGHGGFGLWSARRKVLRNHGDIEVRSRPGKGATFIISLPKSKAVERNFPW